MKYRIICAALVFILGVHRAAGQISPGELSSAHAHLEGMGNCTQCHTMGKALANENCLTCHSEIKNRINAGKGLHASYSAKECVECHKEHHGRNFEIIRFDERTFVHTAAGFALEGKHANLECRKCHTAGKITADDIRTLTDERKKRTFLGLHTGCISCHSDEHRGQVGQDCRQCHGMNGWKPAPKFSHDNAAFRLTGAHAAVQCAKCHKKTLEKGSVTQFVRIEHGSCLACHTDRHKGKFKQECAHCHTTDSWQRVKTSVFDHAATLFPLKGKHATVNCLTCHPKDPKLRNPGGTLGPVITKFAECMDCHSDAHGGQFLSRSDKGNCSSCHTEQGFAAALFSQSDHDRTRFRLDGAHRAVPCGKCHLDGKAAAKSTKQFRWEGTIRCLSCHNDIHRGQFSAKMTEGCETCHSTSAWDDLKFSHEKTRFPLRGKHETVKCSACHTAIEGVVRYTDTPMRCESCHQDRHAGQFATVSGTACEKCHTELGWKNLTFDHSTQSRFALTGKHETVKCRSCHKEALINNTRTVKYKPMEAACIDCHPAQ